MAADDRIDVRAELGSAPKIIGGARDNDAQAVSGVVALRVGVTSFELCSGALIAPNVVLTARHCVANSLTTTVSCDEEGASTNGAHIRGDQDPRNVAVFLGAAPKFNQTPVAVGQTIVAPKTDHLCDSDIALVILDRRIDNVTPMPVRLGSGVAPGETIRSVGYGQNDKRLPIGTRLRRSGVEVLAMGKGVSDSKTALGPHEFEVGLSICQGDSGGPAISEATGAVIGVVSRGGSCEEDFGHIYTTTSGWSALFDETFKTAGGQPTPEDDAIAPLALDPPPKAQPTQATTDDGCSAAPNRTTSTGGGAFALAAALVASVLRRRTGRRPSSKPLRS